MSLPYILFGRNAVRILASVFAISLLSLGSSAFGEETDQFYCEVMAIEGTATLTNAEVSSSPLAEGDLLKADDVVEVSDGSYVDLAYDREWNNVTRIEEGSKIRIKSLYPTTVELDRGAVFAKLKVLPKDSSFDVQTPTAIATVRGTEYRTTFADGQTEVYNISESDVFVYGRDGSGERMGEPVIVQNAQKTHIADRGRAPMPPQRMAERDFAIPMQARQMIENRAMNNIAQGRMGKIQDLRRVEQRLQERKADPARFRSPSAEGSRALVSGEGVKRQDPVKRVSEDVRAEKSFEGRGLGQPTFPSDEDRRSGGPQPAGFPDRRWQSGAERAGEGPRPAARSREMGEGPGGEMRSSPGGPRPGASKGGARPAQRPKQS